ncbi:hypothetical protein [Vibrio splendidus]|uniref:hypothetical protein n=1 Tax=Vibrio splendidus TaxID=29497 RepID=UPI000D3A31AA|nr:hypothetical protein [Vibrio splendidus]PTP70285.1 hypothetical protein CWO00_21420 [Vibrio splendidus]
MSRLDQFRKLQETRSKIQTTPLREASSPELVEAMLNSDVDERRMSSLDYSNHLVYSIDIDKDEAKQLLVDLRGQFNSDRVEKLLSTVQKDIFQSIAGPFGLGKVVSAYDKIGGNVTTINNAQQGIYAQESDEYKRSAYTRVTNSNGEKFEGISKNSVGSKFTKSQMDENGNVRDAYTGKVVRADQTSPDHIVSNSEFHKDGGYMLSPKAKADFGTDERNLASTQRNINGSLSDDDKMEWKDKKQNGRTEINEKVFDIDGEKMQQAYERGHEAAKEHKPTTSQEVKYFAKNTARTGVSEGAKMGAQQGFGILLVELLSQVMKEIQDVFKNGKELDSWIKEIKTRLKRIGNNVAAKWKDALDGFISGGISGFISNFVTVMINRFVTTCKRMVRLIREGVFSLFKAAKTVLFRPEGTSFRESAHEASKLVMSGAIIVGGVLLEEAVDNVISSIPLLAPISTMVTMAIVGSITGIAMAMSAYIIDRLDLLRVIEVEQHNYIVKRLDNSIVNSLERSEEIAEKMEQYVLV